jgi:hypothetical protein
MFGKTMDEAWFADIAETDTQAEAMRDMATPR